MSSHPGLDLRNMTPQDIYLNLTKPTRLSPVLFHLSLELTLLIVPPPGRRLAARRSASKSYLFFVYVDFFILYT